MQKKESIVTTYTDKKIAEKSISEVIKDKETKIFNWLKNSESERRTFSKIFENPIGYGVRKGSDKVEYFNQAMVTLVKDANGNPKILTSYVQ